MGEISKKRGDFGEEIVSKLLQLIGWDNLLTNRDIKCLKGIKHAISTVNRENHGVDFIYQYKCPLFSETQQFALISSKLTDKYDSNPVGKFKRYLKELAHAIECFKISSLRQSLRDNTFGIEYKHSGVIFWLDNQSNYDDVIERLTDFRVENDGEFDGIFLVDNKRASFLYNSITNARSQFTGSNIEFYHPNTGYNTSIRGKLTSSARLPIQYINSSILPLKIVSADGSEYLVLNCIDEFEPDYLRRLISLSHKLTEGWGQKVFILFPQFNLDRNNEAVENIKLEFIDQKFVTKVQISSFNPNFRNVEQFT